MLFLPPFYFVFSARGVLPPFPISVGRDDPGAPLSEFAQGGAACSSQAFPLGGRWHGEAVTDEGAMTERFRFLQGGFRRLRAASDFLDGPESHQRTARPCLKIGNVPDGEGFFRQTRRFDAAILCVLQGKSTQYGEKRTAVGAY